MDFDLESRLRYQSGRWQDTAIAGAGLPLFDLDPACRSSPLPSSSSDEDNLPLFGELGSHVADRVDRGPLPDASWVGHEHPHPGRVRSQNAFCAAKDMQRLREAASGHPPVALARIISDTNFGSALPLVAFIT